MSYELRLKRLRDNFKEIQEKREELKTVQKKRAEARKVFRSLSQKVEPLSKEINRLLDAYEASLP